MTIKQTTGILVTAVAAFALGSCGQKEADDSAPSTDGAKVFFISPTDGDTLTNPVTIEFGIEGMDIVRAGEDAPNSGHHHLIIDAALPDLGQPIPANEHYVHFGDASTSTELTLEPGTHTLQLLLGNYLHIPHDPPVMSATITVQVE